MRYLYSVIVSVLIFLVGPEIFPTWTSMAYAADFEPENEIGAGENDPASPGIQKRLPAIQNRIYRMQHEFNAGIGILPVDAFYKGAAFGAGYAWHLTDIWAIEFHGVYLHNLKTSLRQKLEDLGEPSNRFTELLYYGGVGGLWKPLYGKFSFLNKQLVYGEAFLSLTSVLAMMTGNPSRDESLARGERLGFGAAPGFGFRGYLTPRISLRFDFRYMMLYSIDSKDFHFPLALNLNLCFSTRNDL